MTIKDANDLLKAWAAAGVGLDEQRRRARELLNQAAPMAVLAAEWAGAKQGPERDEAVKTVFGLVAQMDNRDRAAYRTKIAGLLGIGIREFNDIAKASGMVKGDDKKEVVLTLGGVINGWLVEYVYDPVKDESRLAYRDPEGRIGMAEVLEIEGMRYAAKLPNAFVRGGGVLFASDVGPLKGTRELVGMVEEFIHRNYLLENRYLGRIIAYYVLLTWIYDAFNALPYLRAMGEAGAGKSELMRRIGAVCYRLLTSSGASTAAAFFRASEMYRGTVFIDEADLADGGDMANDLVKYLNLGAMKGNPIWRLEEVYVEGGGKTFEPATFQTFGPKLIAMRKDFRDDAVGSRSITLRLMPREPIELKSRGIKLYIDEEFRRQAAALRNMLLRWRLQHWKPEIEISEDHMDLEISSRLNQVTMPLKALAMNDAELMEEIERFLRAYNQELVLSRSMTIAARVVEAIVKIYHYKDLREKLLGVTPDGESEFMYIGDITRVANEIMDTMNAATDEPAGGEEEKKRKKDQLTARGVGSIIRGELQLQVGQRRNSGYPVFWDSMKMMALMKRYGVVEPGENGHKDEKV